MKRTSLHIGVMIALALWSASGLAAPQFDTKVKSTLTGMKPLTETALSDLAGKITVVSFFCQLVSTMHGGISAIKPTAP